MEQCPEFHVVNAIPDSETQNEYGLSYEGFDFGKPHWVDGKEELKHCIRLWPHKIDGEGHFITLLHKEAKEEDYKNLGSKTSTNPMGKLKNTLSEEALDFIKTLKFPIKSEQLVVHEERVYLLPEELPNIKGLRLLRQGLLLGEMKKQRFEPSQALASALRITDYDKIIRFSIDDPMVIRYLKCESIEPEGDFEDGWYLICVEEFPLGWIKIAKNNYKNKYLPGWRWV
jgi:NOL1/NOP2/fmu family ribosome biogenesis protein